MRVVRIRPESFGAWVFFDDGTLAAVDHRRVATLQREHRESLDRTASPIEMHVSVGDKCSSTCTDCYQNASREGRFRDRAEIEYLFDQLAAGGTFVVALGGGEPLEHPEIGSLATAARQRRLLPVLTTSGRTLDDALARTLHGFAQVNVSHDGVNGRYEAVRGYDGVGQAERAIATLAAHGIAVGVNFVLTSESFDALEATAARVADLGARELQLLRLKPAGRAARLAYETRRLHPDQIALLAPTIERCVKQFADRLSFRIDCALLPLVMMGGASSIDPALLRRWGIFGCEASGMLGAVDSNGQRAPCSFLSADAKPRSVGASLLARDAHSRQASASRRDLDASLRAFERQPAEPCASCSIRSVCKGGCKVVSLHEDGTVGPDPECPRVVAYRAGGGFT